VHPDEIWRWTARHRVARRPGGCEVGKKFECARRGVEVELIDGESDLQGNELQWSGIEELVIRTSRVFLSG
jgi:hypothetical protein